MARSASARVPAIVTPFPAARPSAFTTYGGSSRSRNANASAGSVKPPNSGPGMPCRAHSSRAQVFDPSIMAASRVGPKTGRPRSISSSASPATSGISGPTTVRSIDSRSANSAIPGMSPTDRCSTVANSRMPAFPGAA